MTRPPGVRQAPSPPHLVEARVLAFLFEAVAQRDGHRGVTTGDLKRRFPGRDQPQVRPVLEQLLADGRVFRERIWTPLGMPGWRWWPVPDGESIDELI